MGPSTFRFADIMAEGPSVGDARRAGITTHG